MSGFDHDVVIVGSGPAGIAAATALSKAGYDNIIVLEREAEIGGVPRHTHHPSFGLLVFKRPISGPKYIRALRRRCPNVRFETNTTVTAIRPGGELDIASAAGNRTLCARHIILATGARETPRHARLISGSRPMGILTTGALQQFLYLAKMRPFKRAVIVGTELVSFSALWALRSSGIKPVAMVEENPHITAYWPAVLFARLMGVPIHYDSHVTDVSGTPELTQITISSKKHGAKQIDCDGVIFSGKFVGENTIARASHLIFSQSSQIPQMDQNWLSSDPAVSIIGNAAHPADMGDQCYIEGLNAGEYVARLLGKIPTLPNTALPISHERSIKMTTPNIVRVSDNGDTRIDISLHVTRRYDGPVMVTCGDEILYQKTRRCMPARRITLQNVTLTSKQFNADDIIRISLGAPE